MDCRFYLERIFVIRVVIDLGARPASAIYIAASDAHATTIRGESERLR